MIAKVIDLEAWKVAHPPLVRLWDAHLRYLVSCQGAYLQLLLSWVKRSR